MGCSNSLWNTGDLGELPRHSSSLDQMVKAVMILEADASLRWSYIRTSSTASVVPYRHDEYPRFIAGAWPFYSSAISMSIAFLLFCSLWVMLGEGDRKGKKKAE